MNAFAEKSSDVDITVTAPSDNETGGFSSQSEDENSGEFEGEHDEHSSDTADPTTSEQDVGISDNSSNPQNNSDAVDSELCERFDSGVSLNEEKPSDEPSETGEKSSQNYEIVGDRVLVEKDGRFELVDANEIKAEYFEMLGIKPEGGERSKTGEVKQESESPEPKARERPKTTPAFGSRGKDGKSELPKKRVQSSWGYRNSEYSKIKSPYGLSEKQLEIKRKRDEAIARRKKEELDRQKEEENRKREDAEQAFQAWLNSKREEEKERRKMTSKESQEDDKTRPAESKKAFKAWKASKRKQEHVEREAATRRMQETASMYVVHDRHACDEAFRRWLKKKNIEKKMKEQEKKKRLRMKSKQKPKEPLPINSAKIRFTDNYGYRNTVVY